LSKMEHVGTSPLSDCFYISLGNSIHVFCPNAAK
jgi:hypothetical protein